MPSVILGQWLRGVWSVAFCVDPRCVRFLAVLLLVAVTGASGGVAFASDAPVPPPSSEAKIAQPLNDPALEARALKLGHELRCVVCQNQSIAESNAELAHDLMNLVRQMLQEGKSEAEIVAFLVERYGEFVLFQPPFDVRTLALWLGPFALALLAGWGLWRGISRRGHEAWRAPAALSEEERRRADELLRS